MKTGHVFDILNNTIVVVSDEDELDVVWAFEVSNPNDYSLGEVVLFDQFSIEKDNECTVS